MRKNNIGFSSTSGRGISKTKALFDHLSLAYRPISVSSKYRKSYKRAEVS